MSQQINIANEKILVTGCSGFLGEHLCSRLICLGATVMGIDTKISNLINPNRKDSEKFSFINCDISQKSQLEKVFAEDSFDLIFHLAAIANPRTCYSNFDLAYTVNVNGAKNILSMSRASKRLIFMSSASVYGNPIKLPITEDHPLNGSDPYSITKIIGEHLCHNYIDNYGHNISIARNFNAFGMGQTTEYIVPTLITQALNRGKIEIFNSDPVRDLMYVEDSINALITIGVCGLNDVYNIGSGTGIRIGTLAESIRNNIDSKIEIVDFRKEILGSKELVADNAKLKVLGWDQKIGFHSGLSRTIEWFKSK